MEPENEAPAPPETEAVDAPPAEPLFDASAALEALDTAPSVEDESEEGVPFAAFCQPLFDKVIVQMDAPKTREGSLHIPDAHQELPYAATVLAAGQGRLMEGGLAPMFIRPTDRVLFGKYAGIDIPEEYGKRIKVLSQDEILWIFPRGPIDQSEPAETPRPDVGEVPLDRAAAPTEDAKG